MYGISTIGNELRQSRFNKKVNAIALFLIVLANIAVFTGLIGNL